MRILPASLLVLLAGCGGSPAPQAAGAPDTASPSPPLSPGAVAAAAAPSSSFPTLGGRSGELINPGDSTMVMLYFDLSGMAPPLEQWVEEDQRVQFAAGPKKAAMRSQVRAELEATAASVRNAGIIRLSLNTQLSAYDPTYGEFTISALSPSSVVSFNALRQQVTLRFGNGRTAQVWAVAQQEAQALDDTLGYDRSVTVDAVLHISAVQPAPGGGTIIADVVEYELRQARGDRLLARVKPPRP
jgi:hypothetical protein